MRPVLALLATAAPALAHTGPHLHPHDGGSWLGVAAGAGIVALALAAWLRR